MFAAKLEGERGHLPAFLAGVGGRAFRPRPCMTPDKRRTRGRNVNRGFF